MYEKTMLGLAEARQAVEAVLAAANEQGRPVVVAVVDPDGELIAYQRMDGAGYNSWTMAIRKAYTSARTGSDSGEYGQRMAGNAGFGVIDPKYTGWAGAVAVRHEGVVVGAVGVSGLSAEEDEALAKLALAAITG
jgi:glc operon protein GlcG